MGKLKYVVYLAVLLINFKGISQVNLISNPGFESYNACPNFGAEINYCNNWNNVNLMYGVYTVGTPDYFNTCSTVNCQPPNTFAGQCNPHSGNAMIATVMYDVPAPNYREYVSTQLTCPMSVGTTYTVSFWLTNGLNPISPFRIKNIGACFSTTPLTQSGWNLINVVPQVEITTLVGSTSWVQYTFTVTPTSNWQYVTFGSFRTDSQNTPTSTYSITTGNPSAYANYFWDDIAVLAPSTRPLSVSAFNTNISCNGLANGTATINATGGSGTYNYSWLPGGYTTSTVNNLGAGTYTISISDAICNSNTVSITIVDPPPLTVSLTANTYTVCKNTSVDLIAFTNGGTPGYTTNWNTGTINTNSITVNPLVTSIYTYTVSDANNCTYTTSAQINVESTIANFSNSSPPCGSLLTFTNTSMNGNSFVWEFGDGNTSTSQVTTSNNYATSGIYTVTLISSSQMGCKDSIEKTVFIDKKFQTTVFNTNVLCNGFANASATVTAVGAGLYNYLWSPGGYTTPIVNNLAAGVYSVAISDGACMSDTVVTITEPGPLSANILANTYTVCENATVNLIVTNTGGTPGYMIDWSTGSINTNSITVNPSVTSVYTYTVSDANNCTYTTSVQINVESTTANFNNSTSSCGGQITFTNTSVNGSSYVWEFGDGNTSTSQSITSNIYPTSGIYTVTLISSSPIGCKDSIEKTISINRNFNVMALNTNEMCNGASNASATVTAIGTGSYNYSWLPGGYTTSTVNNLSAGVYTITISDGFCMSNTVITVGEPPVLTATLSANAYTVCKNANIHLIANANGGTPTYVYNWSTGATNANTISVSPSVASIYSYTVTDINNCIQTATVQINIDSTIANFSNSLSSCSGQITFTNTSIGGSSFFWDFGDGHSSSASNIASNNYTSNGIYTVTLISVSAIGCKDSIQKPVGVSTNFVKADFDFSNSACIDSFLFINKSVGATLYNWNFGDGTLTSNLYSPTHFYSEGNYQVVLIASNASCRDTIIKNLNFNANNSLDNEIPNIFTPNDDGLNDIYEFKEQITCQISKLSIYNRWGQLMFETDDIIKLQWDGMNKSHQKVPDGTYFYILNAKNGKAFKGTITLVR